METSSMDFLAIVLGFFMTCYLMIIVAYAILKAGLFYGSKIKHKGCEYVLVRRDVMDLYQTLPLIVQVANKNLPLESDSQSVTAVNDLVKIILATDKGIESTYQRLSAGVEVK